MSNNTYQYNPAIDMAPAFAGQIADLMFTDKITLPAATVIGFGLAVYKDANGRAAVGASADLLGVTIHDHTILGGFYPNGIPDGYGQYDAVSVMKRGRIWMRAAGTCTKGGVVNVDGSGLALTAGASLLKGARFLTADMLVTPAMPQFAQQRIVLVELGDPTIDAT